MLKVDITKIKFNQLTQFYGGWMVFVIESKAIFDAISYQQKLFLLSLSMVKAVCFGKLVKLVSTEAIG